MFQSVRPNSQIYVFHKTDKPFLEKGTILSVSALKPKYQLTPTFGQPQEMIVDINVKVGDKNVTYSGLPAQLDIADSYSNGENIVVADSREAMNSEILSLKQKSTDIINSKDFHEKLVVCYDNILLELNPEYAEKQAQKNEIESLKSQITEMSKSMGELMQTNRQLIEQLSKKV